MTAQCSNPINPPVAEADVLAFPASFAQQRLWFLDQLDPGSPQYNLAIAVQISGRLHTAALEQSLNHLVQRHEVLRTTFQTVSGQLLQIVTSTATVPLVVVDLQPLSPAEQQTQVQHHATAAAQVRFDLAQAPLLQVTLLQLADTEQVLLLTLHHIIADAWSIGVLLKELSILYRAGDSMTLPLLPIQYADYAVWQQQWLQGEVMQTQLKYWTQHLANLPKLQLPTDRTRSPISTAKGARQKRTLSLTLTAALKQFSRDTGTTLFMVLLAAFNTLLYRYTGQDDIAVGSPIANRTRPETQNLIGFFVNTLVLRTDLSGNPTFRELVDRTREMTLAAYEHQDLPFEKLVEVLQPERDLSQNPLFQVMLTLQNTPKPDLRLSDLTLTPLDAEKGTAQFDLSLDFVETDSTLTAILEYSCNLFEADTIARMLGHLEILLQAAIAHPDQPVAVLPLLTEPERHRLLYDWNATEATYPQICIHTLFEAQVERTPDAIALVAGAQRLTYRQLNQRANQLAHFLQQQGVQPETLVGICLDRSVELLVSLLAVLKAGGAYVPLDPAYPAERLAFMLADSGAKILLTQNKLEGWTANLSATELKIVRLDHDWEAITPKGELLRIAQCRAENPTSAVQPAHLSYVIYTSGSTGRAKGVEIQHGSLVNAYFAWETAYALRSLRCHLQMASVSFDVFTGDWVRSLCSGARLVLCPRELLLDPENLYALMQREQVDSAEFVPVVLRGVLDYLETSQQRLDFMRLLVCGSDRWYVSEYERIRQRCSAETRLINSFGLTEATIDSSYFEAADVSLPSDALVPIGRPFANTTLYILDAQLQPVPRGITGELYVGGDGLARGYRHRPDLTANRFIPHPFSTKGGDRLYKTGDLARYLPNGQIELLGRIDHQVKVRGVRIELEEIEAALSQHPALHAAVVTVQNDRIGQPQLVAYGVPAQHPAPTYPELRQFLRSRLPEAMIPSVFVWLDAFPTTPNGKINRQALPAPDLSHQETASVNAPPQTPIERRVAQVWSEVLGIREIGVDDNFFDLGGHSLRATQVISRIRQTFELDLPLRTLFECPTIASFATAIETAQATAELENSPKLQPVPRDRNLPLSFAQQRLWFMHQLQPHSAAYNLFEAVRLTGLLQIAALEQSFTALIERHEGLRTTFTEVNGEPIQQIHPPQPFTVTCIDLRSHPPSDREAIALNLAKHETQRPFNLSGDRLLRVTLFQLTDQDHLLLLTLHHIISDAWSMGVLLRDVTTYYQHFTQFPHSSTLPLPIPPLPLQYADYALWQRQWLQGDRLQAHLDYWQQHLGSNLPVLALPTDRPRPQTPSFQGATQSFRLSAPLTQALRTSSRQAGVTLFMTLLAAFQTLLYRYTQQEDLVVGTDLANRNRQETEGLIGFFVNLLVLRTDLSGNPTFRSLLQRVRSVTLGAYAHQDLPFDKLVEALQPQRQRDQTPLFQVLFVMQNVPMPEPELAGLRLSPVAIANDTAKFELALFMRETESELIGTWNYRTELFEADTIARMSRQFVTLIENLVQQPDVRLDSVSLQTDAERQQQQQADQQRQQKNLKTFKRIQPKAIRLSPDA
jgi:amino acid adenylation domain-containing protein